MPGKYLERGEMLLEGQFMWISDVFSEDVSQLPSFTREYGDYFFSCLFTQMLI